MGRKMQVMLQNKNWQLFLIFWIANVVLSIAYKVYYYHTGNHLHYTWLPDMLFFVLVVLTVASKEYSLAFLGALLLLLFKAVGSWSIASYYPNKLDLYKDVIKTWMGYIYIFPLFLFLYKAGDKSSIEIPKYIKHTFVIIAGAIVLSVFVGLIFPVHIFYTYPNPSRFGISGVLYPSSYVSYFYMISIVSTYLLHKRIPSKKVYTILLYTLSLAAIFSGTKSIYLFLLVFYTLFVVDNQYYKKKWLWALVGFVSLGLVVIRHKLASVFHVLVELYRKEDFITFALSYRNIYAESTWLFVQENWTWKNYLIGGLDNVNQLTEMAFIDLFLNFGILGTSVFLLLYYRFIIRHIKWSLVNLVITICIVILISVGGNFFDRVYLAPWLVILFLLQAKEKK